MTQKCNNGRTMYYKATSYDLFFAIIYYLGSLVHIIIYLHIPKTNDMFELSIYGHNEYIKTDLPSYGQMEYIITLRSMQRRSSPIIPSVMYDFAK